MDSSARVIVTGLIAQYPLGGLSWHYLQYVIGLHRLGHDVYYFEDSGQWPYNPKLAGVSKDHGYGVAYLSGIMARFGMEERWAYRFPGGSLPSGEVVDQKWYGLPEAKRKEVIRSADLLINLSCGVVYPENYQQVRHRAFIDTDPVFTQIGILENSNGLRALADAHHSHFSFGENVSKTAIDTGHKWRPTRQPVVLSEWKNSATPRPAFTTVMNWASYRPVAYQGNTYGHKDLEFRRFLTLPAMVAPAELEIAASRGKSRKMPVSRLSRHGWRLVDAVEVTESIDSYRNYVQCSRAEWGVAKNAYVAGRSGWFSERSACYLAAGRPVVVQDTGFGGAIPAGAGVVSFRTLDEAAAGIREVDGNYRKHSMAARAVAEEYFDSRKVLNRLLDEAMTA